MRFDRLLILGLIIQVAWLLWKAMGTSGRMPWVRIFPFMSPHDTMGMTITKLAMVAITGYAISTVLKGRSS